MITSFSYSRDLAIKAESGKFINTTGEYIVQISQVSTWETKSGAQMVQFVFKSTDGAICQSNLCISKCDGTPSFGMSILMALQGIVGAPDIKAEEDDVYSIYDPKNPTQGWRIKALEKKHVGVLLQKELFTKMDGQDSYRMNVYRFFDPKTRRTISEIEAGKQATRIDNDLRSLADSDKRQSTGKAVDSAASIKEDDVPW